MPNYTLLLSVFQRVGPTTKYSYVVAYGMTYALYCSLTAALKPNSITLAGSDQLRTTSELAPNMFGASSELASVMEFGFYESMT